MTVNRPRVVVTDQHVWDYLEPMVTVDRESDWSFADAQDPGITEAVADAHIYVGYRFDEATSEAARELRLLQLTSAGYEHLPFQALRPDLTVCNVFGHERSIAEFVLGGLLAVHRQLILRDRQLREGTWMSATYGQGGPPIRNLQGQHMTVLGYGHIGQVTAGLCAAVGMQVSAVTRRPERHTRPPWLTALEPMSELDTLLNRSDALVVALPLTTELRGIIGRAELNRLGPSAVLVNVGRGDLVEETALYEALASGNLGAAVIDVWYRYPNDGAGQGRPSRHPFEDLPNVLMSPHTSGAAQDTFRVRAEFVVENVASFLAGRPVQNRIPVPSSTHPRKDNTP